MKEIHITEEDQNVSDENHSIFHARFGKWENENSLVFGDSIDIPYATDQFSLVDLDEEAVIGLHAQIAEGIYALAIVGMDDSGVEIFQDSGNQGARFEIASFSWSETPVYLHLRDRKQILEITHDSRINVDKSNEEYRKLHPEPLFPEPNPKKIYVIPLDQGRQFNHLG